MSLATPRPHRSLNGSVHTTATSTSSCPPSPPPPVFSLTSAFFESPFSASQPQHARPQSHNSPAATTSEQSGRPSLGAGFALQQVLIAEEQPHHHPEIESSGSDWRASEEWTPLSTRRSSGPATALKNRLQTPAQPVEDRLDRLLAEIEGSSSSTTTTHTTLAFDSPSLASSSSSSSLLDCWELHSLETRFHPLHHHPSSSSSSPSSSTHNSPLVPLRPCLKIRSTSVSSLNSSSSSSNTRSSTTPSSSNRTSSSSSSSSSCASSSSECSGEEEEEDGSLNSPFERALDSPALDADEFEDAERTIRVVRFDDASVEEFLTWSRESYDRKGPLPITKLNVREVIELKLIKEELGISPTSVSISPSSSSSSSSSDPSAHSHPSSSS